MIEEWNGGGTQLGFGVLIKVLFNVNKSINTFTET